MNKFKKVDACFSCLTPFEKGIEPLTHPIYPGEVVCETCETKIKKDFKYMLDYYKKEEHSK